MKPIPNIHSYTASQGKGPIMNIFACFGITQQTGNIIENTIMLLSKQMTNCKPHPDRAAHAAIDQRAKDVSRNA